MTVTLDDWPDPLEACMVRTSELPGTGGIYVPDDVAGRMPWRHFYLSDGNDDGISERVLIGCQVFAPSYQAGREHAGLVRQLLLTRFVAGWTVTLANGRIFVADRVVTAQRPMEVPWGDSRVRRWVSSYWVTQRR